MTNGLPSFRKYSAIVTLEIISRHNWPEVFLIMVGFSKMHMSLSFQQSPISQWNKETVSVYQQGIIGNPDPSRNSLKSLAFVPSPGDYCQRGKLKTTPCQKVIESSPSTKISISDSDICFFCFLCFRACGNCMWLGVDAMSGQRLWQLQLPGVVFASPCVDTEAEVMPLAMRNLKVWKSKPRKSQNSNFAPSKGKFHKKSGLTKVAFYCSYCWRFRPPETYNY